MEQRPILFNQQDLEDLRSAIKIGEEMVAEYRKRLEYFDGTLAKKDKERAKIPDGNANAQARTAVP